MKTTDGKEAVIGAYYYLENGQCVILNDCGVTSAGKDMFVVTPFYEGEAMTASGDGGYHQEFTCNYEHEGMEIIAYSIFEVAPRDKLDEKYKLKLNEIEKLTLALGGLMRDSKNLVAEKQKIERSTAEAAEVFAAATTKTQEAGADLESAIEKITEKRQHLSELEDSITGLKSEDVSSLISKEELQRLNRVDFKMRCLEAGGVDNWEWYDESLNDYRERYPG